MLKQHPESDPKLRDTNSQSHLTSKAKWPYLFMVIFFSEVPDSRASLINYADLTRDHSFVLCHLRDRERQRQHKKVSGGVSWCVYLVNSMCLLPNPSDHGPEEGRRSAFQEDCTLVFGGIKSRLWLF